MSVWVYRNILGMKAYGLDISEFATENAIKLVKKYIVCDDIGVGKLKLKKRKYDMVVSHDTLEHFHPASFDKAIKNIFSITDTALFEIYTLDSLVAKLHNLNKIVHIDHLSEHTTNWWINMFSDSGFVATQVPFMRKGVLLVRKRQGNH
jgi:cyclopropane fatty-acyl-phospholipid synthase-like methyltransferase